jgi:phosphonopyruvate decarboxylase
MIAPERLYQFFKEKGISFYAGVPDSLLKDFLKYLQDHSTTQEHVITANEGLAVSLVSGYHFSSGKLPLVYLQNSGLGNLVNPLTSLADKEMYSVPMLLLIGWRGRPGVKDEPQHIKMGRITVSLLDVLEVPVYLLDENEALSFEKINSAVMQAIKEQRPVALLAPEGIFEKYKGNPETDTYPLVREEVIKKIIAQLKGDETVICTTGKIGREFYEQNIATDNKIKKYLLSAGAMGHANHIALGIKMHTAEKVIMLDGDGAVLMHMGALPSVASYTENNFIHVVLNNGSHESVGGQPTEAFFADLCAVAKASGYRKTICITNDDELASWLQNDLNDTNTQFVEIRTSRKSRNELGRPKGDPSDWKDDYMKQTGSLK